MARRLIQRVEVTDDLDGSVLPDNTKSVQIGINGYIYTIDTSDARARELMESLEVYLNAAHSKRRAPKGVFANAKIPIPAAADEPASQTRRLPPDRAARATMREWCRQNGWDVKERGIVPSEAVLAYRDANPDAYIPDDTLRIALEGLAFKEAKGA